MDRLLIIDDEGKRRAVELDGERVTVGRLASNRVQLEGENVSRRHALLTRTAAREASTATGWRLEDLASYNGVTLNDAPLERARTLAHGDRFVIGDHTLVLHADGRPEPTGATVRPARFDDDEPEDQGPAHDFDDPPVRTSAPPSAPGERAALPAFQMKGTTDELLAAAVRGSVPLDVRQMRLVFLEPADAPAPVTLEKLPMVLGRGAEADVRFDDPSVAEQHATLRVRDGGLWIEPTGPEAVVEVDGERIETGRALTVGAAIKLGAVTARLARRHRIAPLPTPTYDPDRHAARREGRAPIPGPGRAMVLLTLGVVVLAAVLVAVLREPPTRPDRPPRPLPAHTVVVPESDATVAADVVVDATPPMDPTRRLALARRAFEELEFDTTLSLLAPLETRSDLPAAQQIDAALMETACFVSMNGSARASDACVRALAAGFDPDHAPDQPPRVRAACRAARDRDGATQPVPASPGLHAPATSSAPPGPSSTASRP